MSPKQEYVGNFEDSIIRHLWQNYAVNAENILTL